MKKGHWSVALPAMAILALGAAPASAQRAPSPQQQIAILQQQLAASQASALSLAQRLDAVERQLQQLVNLEEQNGHRVTELESSVTQIRSDEDSRVGALEQKVANLAAAPAPEPAPEASDTAPAKETASSKSKSKTEKPTGSKPKAEAASALKDSAESDNAIETASDDQGAPSDPGEDAYSQGYHLWADGDYDGAVRALKAFTTKYPDHRRVSWANNLIGRALLDEGQPRAAAEALLSNYRKDPGGGRAQDSLYYLAQALMKLNQPTQACKAYAELDSVYGSKIRPEIKELETKGKAAASCQ